MGISLIMLLSVILKGRLNDLEIRKLHQRDVHLMVQSFQFMEDSQKLLQEAVASINMDIFDPDFQLPTVADLESDITNGEKEEKGPDSSVMPVTSVEELLPSSTIQSVLSELQYIFGSFSFKGFGIALRKSVVNWKSAGFSIRIPVTTNFPVYDTMFYLPKVSMSAGISYPMTYQISTSVSFPLRAVALLRILATEKHISFESAASRIPPSDSLRRVGISYSWYYKKESGWTGVLSPNFNYLPDFHVLERIKPILLFFPTLVLTCINFLATQFRDLHQRLIPRVLPIIVHIPASVPVSPWLDTGSSNSNSSRSEIEIEINSSRSINNTSNTATGIVNVARSAGSGTVAGTVNTSSIANMEDDTSFGESDDEGLNESAALEKRDYVAGMSEVPIEVMSMEATAVEVVGSDSSLLPTVEQISKPIITPESESVATGTVSTDTVIDDDTLDEANIDSNDAILQESTISSSFIVSLMEVAGVNRSWQRLSRWLHRKTPSFSCSIALRPSSSSSSSTGCGSSGPSMSSNVYFAVQPFFPFHKHLSRISSSPSFRYWKPPVPTAPPPPPAAAAAITADITGVEQGEDEAGISTPAESPALMSNDNSPSTDKHFATTGSSTAVKS